MSAQAATVPSRDRRVLRSTSRSHVGRLRLLNEDRVFDDAQAGVWAVADGMGGHYGGDLAAQQVIDALRTACASGQPDVRAALSSANAAIIARNRQHGTEAGATAVAASIGEDALDILWAGDSRAYRLAGGRLDQLTRDHSLVQELVDAGVISSAVAERHPKAHIVTRALGVGAESSLEAISVSLAPTDVPARFLLCSDGLSRSLVADEPMPDVSLDQLAEHLLQGALERDGADNISLVLIEVAVA